MVTQIGYALGLLFIIPLGDLFPRRKIILVNFSILILSLLSIALSPNLEFILLASFFTGLCSIMPQIFIPIAAQFSTPETKGKNVGIIVSGLLTGILGSRVVSGIVGEIMGWRFMFFAAAVLMILSCEIVAPTGQRLSRFASFSPACRTGVRFFPGSLELPGIPDGTGAFLCRQSRHRLVRTVRSSRSHDSLVRRTLCPESRRQAV